MRRPLSKALVPASLVLLVGLGGRAGAQEHAHHGAPGGSHDVPAAVAEAEGDAEHPSDATEAQHGPPKPINWFDFGNKEQPPYGAMLLNFALLVGIYVYFGKKPIGEALKNRRASVAKEIEEAQRIRAEAEARAVVYQEKLAHLEEELRETRAALVEAGKTEGERIVREANEKAARMERDTAFLVEQELKQMRAELTREAVSLAVQAAEEILKKRVTPADQERLAEDYLSELVAKARPNAPPAAGGSGGNGGGVGGSTVSRPPPSLPPRPGAVGPESRRGTVPPTGGAS